MIPTMSTVARNARTAPTHGPVMDGFLLSYYRSRHPSLERLHVFRDFDVAIPGNDRYRASFDYVIYNASTGRVLAAYALVTRVADIRPKLRTIRLFRQHAAGSDMEGIEMGLVVPKGLAQRARPEAEALGVPLVTYAD